MTTPWIKLEAFSDYFPEVEGSVKVHHCKDGRHNDRFYLTRTSDGRVLGYCFHCGGRGVYTPSRRAFKESQSNVRKPPPTTTKDPFKAWDVPPLDEWETSSRWCIQEWGKIPLDIRKWWFLAGLNINEFNELGIKLLDGRMPAIPLRKDNEDLPTGLALRSFNKSLPKWILLGEKIQGCLGTETSTLVLTEDYLSALRCSRQYSALPLMGTSLSTENFKRVTNWSKSTQGRVVVWLDNDSPQVIHKAKNIYERLNLLVNCTLILTTKEPKHLKNDSDIAEIITDGN